MVERYHYQNQLSMKSLVLAVDFDGTITEESFPEVGALRQNADVVLRKLYEDGHKIVINTCRTGKYEGLAEYFLIKHEIPFHFINSNLPELITKYKQDSRKISADVYIDNRCLMGLPPTWDEIYEIINKMAQE